MKTTLFAVPFSDLFGGGKEGSMAFTNWYSLNIRYPTIYPDAQEFRRETEGRKTAWSARVWLENETWKAEVTRHSGRKGRLHCVFDFKPDGKWIFAHFPTPESAMAHVEEYISIRRNPDTWHGIESRSLKQRLSELEQV